MKKNIIIGIVIVIVFVLLAVRIDRDTDSDINDENAIENDASASQETEVVVLEHKYVESVEMDVLQDDVVKDMEIDTEYFVHKDITTTLFWVGENADDDNGNISNRPSAWDEKWVKHYGGVDHPKKRDGYFPKKFIPKENPFYFALPYNDFDEDGNHKKDVTTVVPWAKDVLLVEGESICKNRWIKIMYKNKVAYAQWEDVGPFNEDDQVYVFGIAKPENDINKHAGLDVSPAVNDYLSLDGVDSVDWQFVDDKNVPDGPWKQIITTSGVYWK